MPEKKTVERARKARREGKAPSTQAGEFIREEIHHVREGKHGARSPEQVIAIGLSKARRAGVQLPPPPKGKTSKRTRKNAAKAAKAGRRATRKKPSAKRSRAARKKLKGEPRSTASRSALSRHARKVARKSARKRTRK